MIEFNALLEYISISKMYLSSPKIFKQILLLIVINNNNNNDNHNNIALFVKLQSA